MKAPRACSCAFQGSVTVVPVSPIDAAVSAQRSEHARGDPDRVRRGREDHLAVEPSFCPAGPLFLPVSVFGPVLVLGPVPVFLPVSAFRLGPVFGPVLAFGLGPAFGPAPPPRGSIGAAACSTPSANFPWLASSFCPHSPAFPPSSSPSGPR